MSNILCNRRNERWIRHHTNNIIINDDIDTHLIEFKRHSTIFKMSIAKSKYIETDSYIIGYFQYSWGTVPVTNIPNCNNIAVAFTGYADPNTALQQSNNIYNTLQGNKYISLGGGYGSDGTPNAGKFNSTVLTNILTAINNGNFSLYSGILFDVEYCDTAGLYDNGFKQVFAAAKIKNLVVIVCVGHSGNITDLDTYTQDTALMTSFLYDPNVDYISPQLYSSGSEDPPQFNVNGLQWSSIAGSGKKILPAIPWAQQYAEVETWANTQGMSLSGFIQWNNTAYSGGGGGGGGSNFNITLTITNNTTFAYINPPNYQKDTNLTIIPGNTGLKPTGNSTGYIVPIGTTWTGSTTSASNIQLNFSDIYPANAGALSLGNGVQTGFSFGAGNTSPNLFSAVVIVTDSHNNILSNNTFNDANPHNIGPSSPPYIPNGSKISITYSGQAGPAVP